MLVTTIRETLEIDVKLYLDRDKVLKEDGSEEGNNAAFVISERYFHRKHTREHKIFNSLIEHCQYTQYCPATTTFYIFDLNCTCCTDNLSKDILWIRWDFSFFVIQLIIH